MDTTDRLGRILGPGAAGILIAVLPEIHFFTLDAATFFLSSLSLTAIGRFSGRAERRTPRGVSFHAEVLTGLRAIASNAVLRVALFVRGSGNLVWPVFSLGAPILVVHRFHATIGAYGLILAAYGAGNLAGNLVAGNVELGRRLLAVYCASWGLIGGGFVGFAWAPSLPWGLGASLWMGLFAPLANVSMDAYIARTISRELLGRVYAFQRMVVVGANTAGLVGAGWALGVLPAGAVLAASGVWITGIGLTGLVRIGRSFTRPYG
jgi:MFS family permease